VIGKRRVCRIGKKRVWAARTGALEAKRHCGNAAVRARRLRNICKRWGWAWA
jgi:hypothetical protein